MLSGAAFCPHPPALVPAVAAGAAPELDQLRLACRTAIARVVAPGHQLVLIGAGPASVAHSALSRGTLAGFGVPLEVHLGAPSCGGAVELPLSLTVGAWLVEDALGPRSGVRGFSIGPGFGSSRAADELLALAADESVCLLVMGDGSARRGVTAPGYLDERAVPFDQRVGLALATGDTAVLAALDEELGAELLAAGVPAWRLAGSLLDGGDYSTELLYDDDPYGVAYFVAAWQSLD